MKLQEGELILIYNTVVKEERLLMFLEYCFHTRHIIKLYDIRKQRIITMNIHFLYEPYNIVQYLCR